MSYLNFLPTALFYMIAIFAIYISFRCGDNIDKKISTATLCATIATTLSQDYNSFNIYPLKLLIIDCILFIFSFYFSIKSSKYWPLLFCSAILVGIMTHIAAMFVIKIPTIPYLSAVNIWGFVCTITMIGGVLIEKDQSKITTQS